MNAINDIGSLKDHLFETGYTFESNHINHVEDLILLLKSTVDDVVEQQHGVLDWLAIGRNLISCDLFHRTGDIRLEARLLHEVCMKMHFTKAIEARKVYEDITELFNLIEQAIDVVKVAEAIRSPSPDASYFHNLSFSHKHTKIIGSAILPVYRNHPDTVSSKPIEYSIEDDLGLGFSPVSACEESAVGDFPELSCVLLRFSIKTEINIK